MQKNLFVVILFTLVLFTTACTQKHALPIKAASSELKIEPSSSKVETFLSKNRDFISSYEKDTCFNITPDFIANNSEFSIFKYNMSAGSFLLFDNVIYTLGGNVTSVALGDLDNDNKYELYFTFSWGSGISRSQIGYFNPSTKKVSELEYINFNHDLILTTNEAETSLLVSEATIEYQSLVDYIIKPSNLLFNL